MKHANTSAEPHHPAGAEPGSAEAENQFHDYRTNVIPWYVRLIWLGFWAFAIYYTVHYLFVDLKVNFALPK